VQYSYDDHSVLVVNSTLAPHSGLTVTARVVDIDGTEKLARQAIVDVPADGVAKALAQPAPDAVSPTYFLFLTLDDAHGRTVSRNVYWLSTRRETLAWERSKWYVTPVSAYADLTGLQQLPPARVRVDARFEATGEEGRALVRIENTSRALAFFLRASVRRGPDGEEVLPVFWDDDYVTLLPGETRELVARYATRNLGDARPAVTIEGWNVARATANPLVDGGDR
jgi:exo-1,4-beta-D-glucosaminidase